MMELPSYLPLSLYCLDHSVTQCTLCVTSCNEPLLFSILFALFKQSNIIRKIFLLIMCMKNEAYTSRSQLWLHQDIYRSGIETADESILGTALGEDYSKDYSLFKVVIPPRFVIVPPRNSSTDCAYHDQRVFLFIQFL